MDDHSQPVDTATLTFLRRLVTALTGTMIVGLLVIIVLFVIRFSEPGIKIPDGLQLPAGTQITAYTQTPRWVAVTTEDDRILIFDPETGTLMREIEIRFE